MVRDFPRDWTHYQIERFLEEEAQNKIKRTVTTPENLSKAEKSIVREAVKRMIWHAVIENGQDTIDRMYRDILSQACNNDAEEREFLEAMYNAESWAYQSEEARKSRD